MCSAGVLGCALVPLTTSSSGPLGACIEVTSSSVSVTGEEEHWRRVEEEWNKMPDSVCKNLVASMPRRVQAVIKAKGGYTKY